MESLALVKGERAPSQSSLNVSGINDNNCSLESLLYSRMISSGLTSSAGAASSSPS